MNTLTLTLSDSSYSSYVALNFVMALLGYLYYDGSAFYTFSMLAYCVLKHSLNYVTVGMTSAHFSKYYNNKGL